MQEGDFELDGYRMGHGLPIAVEGFDPGTIEWIVQDKEDPATGFRHFGRDAPTGPTWGLDLATSTETVTEARSAMNALARAWRGVAPGTPGAESVLRYMIDGEIRRVYGRPRNLSPVVNGLQTSARIALVADFVTAEALVFDEETRTETLRIVPKTTGGFTAPFTSPIITAATGEIQGSIGDVGGTEPTPFELRISGPITDPRVSGDGWAIELRRTLAYDEIVTIDTRRKTAVNNFGASLAGSLTFGSRLAEARLHPGPDFFRFTGTDSTGTAEAALTWRPAYSGL